MRFILLETAMGYLLFERKESDEIGATLPEVQVAVKDYGKFSLVLKLKARASPDYVRLFLQGTLYHHISQHTHVAESGR